MARFQVFRPEILVLAALASLGGADRDRTDDLRLAKPALSQLSYSPGHISSGPGQSRTADLTLIRRALSPTELLARKREEGCEDREIPRSLKTERYVHPHRETLVSDSGSSRLRGLRP